MFNYIYILLDLFKILEPRQILSLWLYSLTNSNSEKETK